MQNQIIDLSSELIRLISLTVLVIILVKFASTYKVKNNSGWYYIIIGIVLIKFGTITDIIGDVNITYENKILHIFLESVFGYLFGFISISVGLLKWLPNIGIMHSTAKIINNANNSIKEKINLSTNYITDKSSAKNLFLDSIETQIKEETKVLSNYVDSICSIELAEEQKKYLQEANQSAEKLSFLAQNIRDINKITTEDFKIKPVDICLIKIKEILKNKYTETVKAKNLDFDIEIDKRISKKYFGPGSELFQILSKFIESSIVNTSSGYIKLDIYLGVTIGDSNYIHFQISDTGKELPITFSTQFKDYVNNILPTENNNHTRFGIGMDIASKLLDKLQGNLDTNKTCFSDVVILDISIPLKIKI